MNKLIQFVKSIRLSQVIVAFLAGFILLVNTACSMAPGDPNKVSLNGKTPDYDYYDANQPYQGGMNRYNDDKRLDNPVSAVKPKQLIDNAKVNLDTSINPEQVADRVDKSVNNAKDNISQNTEDFAEGTRKGIFNIKRNVDKATKEVTSAASDATDAVKTSIDDTVNATGRVVDSAKDKISDRF